MKKKLTKEKLISIITVVVIFAVWYIITNYNMVDAKLVPTPQKTWEGFLTVIKDYKGHSLLEHLAASMQRLFIAFGLAVITAVPLGLLSGYSSKVRAVMSPIIEFYRPLPPLAYYTLLVLALGIGDESKIALLYLACFAPIYISCMAGVMKVSNDFINSALTLGASKTQVFIKVIFPSCLQEMFTGIRTAIGVAYSTLVAAEMVAASSGIGWMVLDAKNWFRNDVIFVGIIVMGITGILIDAILKLIERKVVPWAGKA
ncbi:MAG: ABC transporter permease [Thomasclavelia sp.]|jgi:taurine transport system permease protein|nr:ABC transporter permease [Thomasclavelia sp.]